MFNVKTFKLLFKKAIKKNPFDARKFVPSLIFLFGGLLFLSFSPSLSMEKNTFTRPKRHAIQDEEIQFRTLHLDIFEALAQSLTFLELYDLEFKENLPSYPNHRVSKLELTKALNLLMARDHVIKTGMTYSNRNCFFKENRECLDV